MKSVVLFSGLGNQIFQYAFYLGLKSKYNDVSIITNQTFGKNQHNGEELCKIFNINPTYNTWFYSNNIMFKIYKKMLLQSKLAKVYTNEYEFLHINKKPFEVYIGYFMNLKYFDFIRNELINTLETREKLDLYNLEIINKMKSTNSLGIHIRRGDFLSFQGGIGLSLDYYKNAINFINDKNMHIFIFSDDIEFVKNDFIKLLSKNRGGVDIIDFNRGKNSYKDLILMKECKYLITANSSFSYFGAYLNKYAKLIITPKNWLGNIGDNTKYFIPKHWVKI